MPAEVWLSSFTTLLVPGLFTALATGSPRRPGMASIAFAPEPIKPRPVPLTVLVCQQDMEATTACSPHDDGADFHIYTTLRHLS